MPKLLLQLGIPACLIVLVGLFVTLFDPLESFDTELPPDEGLKIERGTTESDGIDVWVRGNGKDPITIAQVQVDGAYWSFSQTPKGELTRFDSALIKIPYPWVDGETHHLAFVSSTGTIFDHSIEVARPSTALSLGVLGDLALLGLFVGLVPVALGLATLPLLRKMGSRGLVFSLALTVGLLAYLLVDTLAEGLELAADSAGIFQTDVLFWVVAALTFAVLMSLSRLQKKPTSGIGLATWLALGIGLHNFGEGLSIGHALILGNAALGSLLIVGFTIHNLTEGIAIAAPLTKIKPSIFIFVALSAIAGLPAIAGTWVGAFVFLPHWGAIFFGIAAGAILHVIIEVTRFIKSMKKNEYNPFSKSTSYIGFGAGILAMYATALLIQV